MSTEAQRVLDEALKLCEEDRSVLALLLLDSVGEQHADVEAAWREEIAARLGDLRAGKVDLVPWEEARARIFARQRRARVEKRNWKVVLDPRAAAEARSAFLWYLERNPRAAEEFQATFDGAIRDVGEAPLRWPEFDQGTRRRLFGKFPYSLIYTVEGDSVVVLAVMHQRRRPGYWKTRKQQLPISGSGVGDARV